MRLIIVDAIKYDVFEQYRDECLAKVPQGLISAQYSKKLEKATFWFWDADYVPENLKKFMKVPPPVVNYPPFRHRVGDTYRDYNINNPKEAEALIHVLLDEIKELSK